MGVDWSTLPLDLLGDIAMRMETMEDFVYFSAVCHSWNCVSSLIKHQWRPIPMPPWLLLTENTSNNPDCVRKIFNPSNNKVYKLKLPETFGARCWGSNYGWLAMIDRKFNVRLFNPITKAVIHFPSAETIPGRTPYIPANETEEEYMTWVLGCFFIRLIVLKVSETEFVILIIHDYYKQLVFAKQGDKLWTPVFVYRGDGVRMFDIVAMDDGYVFGLYNDGSLVYWNIADFQGHELVKPIDYSLTKIEMHDDFLTGMGFLYLVQSGCDLLMVLRFKDEYNNDVVYETSCFSVYRLDRKDRRWEEITDHATLFVGRNSAMSVSAKCLQPNQIYFADDEFELSSLVPELGGADMGVYDSKSEEIWQFYEGDDTRSEFNTPNWFMPQL